MRILINGILPYESGKTTLALALLKKFYEVGFNALPLKPMAGHNIWYSYHTVSRSMELKLLVGNDALKYLDESGANIRLINPFAVLFSPVDLEKIAYNISLYENLMYNGLPIMVRYSNCIENFDYHYVSLESLEIIPDSIRKVVEEMLNKFNVRFTTINSIKEFIDQSPTLIDQCLPSIFSRFENTLLESYNDAVAPSFLSLNADYIVLVSPGKAFLFDGKEVRKIVDLIALPPWVIKGRNLIKYGKPIKSFSIETGYDKFNNEILDYIFKK
jgi:predicted P-loop ATPase/GTPase